MRATNLLNCLNTAGAGVGAPSYRMLTDLDVATHCDGHGCWLLESAAVFRSDRPDRGVRFATDSPLEGTGFELPVPRDSVRAEPISSRAASMLRYMTIRRTRGIDVVLDFARAGRAAGDRQAG